jgi:hypothetical protein
MIMSLYGFVFNGLAYQMKKQQLLCSSQNGYILEEAILELLAIIVDAQLKDDGILAG